MLEMIGLVPALPLASSALLALFGSRLRRWTVAAVGAGSIAASAVLGLAIALEFLRSPARVTGYTTTLWQWFAVDGLTVRIGCHLDALALVMVLTVTFVGFLIHVYSTEFMQDDPGYSRFFAYMNLFVASMLVLLLADDLVLLYLGWEGVGLCSFLLIGFWYQDPRNGRAGRKAFIVTRVGDTALALGLFLLFRELGTLRIQELLESAPAVWPTGSLTATAVALLLLGGAIGKSAQLPLQTWLPDAMAGPTPTSALIHAATMVTAGVYLIARTHVLFQIAPAAQLAVAVVGTTTLVVAGLSALAERDLKRILAYSTVSQIGYMFLALGVGAWNAAIFHFLTHAFFKSLLFLGAGVVIEALAHEHDILKMGGLRRQLPVTFWFFLAGGSSLAGLPLVTAGYYSKDLILWSAAGATHGGRWFGAGAFLGAALTSLYTFRVVFAVFFGPAGRQVVRKPGWRMLLPVGILALLSLLGALFQAPLMEELANALPTMQRLSEGLSEHVTSILAATAFGLGLLVAWLLHLRRQAVTASAPASPVLEPVRRFLSSDWGMDWLYDRLLVSPVVAFARINRSDAVDSLYDGLAHATRQCHRILSRTETGSLRWYAAWLTAGSVVLIAMMVLL